MDVLDPHGLIETDDKKAIYEFVNRTNNKTNNQNNLSSINISTLEKSLISLNIDISEYLKAIKSSPVIFDELDKATKTKFKFN
jgi:hypothetical protein